MMHTISGALRLLSPSSAPALKLEAREPEQRQEPQGGQGAQRACPLCSGDTDRVPPLPGVDRRRSSGYSHELREIREGREGSPRNKAATCEEEL